MYLPKDASKIRQREAENARRNRAEIVKALADGQITKRDLFRMGLFTAGGLLIAKNGLSPFARSAFAAGSTGVPRTPLGAATPFTQAFPRLRDQSQSRFPITRVTPTGSFDPKDLANTDPRLHQGDWGSTLDRCKRLSYHDDFTNYQATQSDKNPKTNNNPYCNKTTFRGPMEGRPPGEAFSHQKWNEYFPKVGYYMSLAQCQDGSKFHPLLPSQNPNSVWCYGTGSNARGVMPPPLIKLRYGEPVIMRIYNRLPPDQTQNGGFGRNQSQLHFHNMHNGAESDGAANVHHYPGTFYDYRWSQTLARADYTNTDASDERASGPDDSGGLVNVPGDWKEIVGTMWAHDHRFFFTAENVYKGNLMMNNVYSGRDRGNEHFLGNAASDRVNLRLPSGYANSQGWGNNDFDINIIHSDGATDKDGQYFFDIFTTDGFVGDLPLVNFTYKPVLEVLPRKYRFRLINASMSRFIQLAIADSNAKAVPFQFIANDGNLVVNPITLTQLDQQGIAERYDIVVDFSKFRVGDELYLVNVLQQTGGNKPDGALTLADAFAGKSPDPVVGKNMKFKIVSQLQSQDDPSVTLHASDPDLSQVPSTLTEQIPIVAPVRTRVVEFGRGNGDSRGANGQCTPDCSEVVQGFPWIIKVNGQSAHSMNANRISELIRPLKPGEAEHWTYINGGGGWDHPIHLHFEEGVTMNRGNDSIPATEKLVRKDVWRLRPSGRVQFQIRFGEYAGSYVNHCHNTVHEDFALLMRIQVLGGERAAVTATPNPTEDGIVWTTPQVLAEGDPLNTKFFQNSTSGGGGTTTTTSTSGSSGSGGSGGSGGTAKPSGKG